MMGMSDDKKDTVVGDTVVPVVLYLACFFGVFLFLVFVCGCPLSDGLR